MQRQPVITKDGSLTLAIPDQRVTYHSLHGAVQESQHVYIKAGLLATDHFNSTASLPPALRIFEMGYGTGLNALLTLVEATGRQQPIHYTAVELFPLSSEEAVSLNYCQHLQRTDLYPLFETLHTCEWEKEIAITPFFTLRKIKDSLQRFISLNNSNNRAFDLVYYDAFAPAAQPELWTEEIFRGIYSMMATGGILVTYCSKGDVRRAMQAAGFEIEKLQGPQGKREIIRGRNKAQGTRYKQET